MIWAMIFSSVDFPAPLGPVIATISLRFATKETGRKIALPLKRFVISLPITIKGPRSDMRGCISVRGVTLCAGALFVYQFVPLAKPFFSARLGVGKAALLLIALR